MLSECDAKYHVPNMSPEPPFFCSSATLARTNEEGSDPLWGGRGLALSGAPASARCLESPFIRKCSRPACLLQLGLLRLPACTYRKSEMCTVVWVPPSKQCGRAVQSEPPRRSRVAHPRGCGVYNTRPLASCVARRTARLGRKKSKI